MGNAHEEKINVLRLEDLEVYRLAVEISGESWKLYEKFDWQIKKTMGDQWITAVDSIGANIAEGFGRFHFLDKNKFNYNARGSLLETVHWTKLLFDRGKINKEFSEGLLAKLEELRIRLNSYISVTKEQVK